MSAATSHSTHSYTLMPFYIYYSMFGFQRIGDLAWAAGDLQARTVAALVAQPHHAEWRGFAAPGWPQPPAGVHYSQLCQLRPAKAIIYELAVIIHDGMRRMFVEQEPLFYYITVMNENYQHPVMPEGAEEGILKGMYMLRSMGDG